MATTQNRNNFLLPNAGLALFQQRKNFSDETINFDLKSSPTRRNNRGTNRRNSETIKIFDLLQDISPLIEKRRREYLKQEFNSLSSLYEFREQENIENFILKNDFLFNILKEARIQIRKVFGENTRLALKISSELEPISSEELWILILTELTAKEAFPLLEKFDENWWLDNLGKANAKLNIRLEYI